MRFGFDSNDDSTDSIVDLFDFIPFQGANGCQSRRVMPGVIEQTDMPEGSDAFLGGNPNQLIDPFFRQWGMCSQRNHKIQLSGITEDIHEYAEQEW